MPKATLTFDLPEESHEHQCAVKGAELAAMFSSLMLEFRSADKYDTAFTRKITKPDRALVDAMRQWLVAEIEDRHLQEVIGY